MFHRKEQRSPHASSASRWNRQRAWGRSVSHSCEHQMHWIESPVNVPIVCIIDDHVSSVVSCYSRVWRARGGPLSNLYVAVFELHCRCGCILTGGWWYRRWILKRYETIKRFFLCRRKDVVTESSRENSFGPRGKEGRGHDGMVRDEEERKRRWGICGGRGSREEWEGEGGTLKGGGSEREGRVRA